MGGGWDWQAVKTVQTKSAAAKVREGRTETGFEPFML